MNIKVRTSSVLPMIELCKKHNKGQLSIQELKEILDHDDYKIEFERYNAIGLPICNISKEEFIDYFLQNNFLEIQEITNERLKIHHYFFKKFMNNLDNFQNMILKLLSVEEDYFINGFEYTFNGLPKEISFDNFEIIFTVSIGNSFGWPWPPRNCMHFDVIQFFEKCNLNKPNVFKAFLSHELHHIGFSRFSDKVDKSCFTIEDELYFFLAFEGLAVKYCNNGAGQLTKPIYNDLESNIGMDLYTFNYFKDRFNQLFDDLKYQIRSIRNGNVNDLSEIKKYWLNLHTHEQEQKEVPLLQHSANYYIGMEIWGLIHDVYGKEKVFEVLAAPKLFPETFNYCLRKIGREDLIL